MGSVATSPDLALNLLEALVRCPSVTPEPAGVFEVLERALAPLGFAVVRLRFEGDGSYPVENIFATRGSTGRHLLFAGHTDVVPAGDPADWTHPPFAAEIAEGRLYGRGAADMKSGIAAFVAAVAQAIETGDADRGTISLLITNDEEADSINGTEKAIRWAAEAGHHFDFAIVGEPSAVARVGDSIKVGRRGSLNGDIVVTGVQGHSAYPERAVNPLPLAAALVAGLSGRLDEGSALFPPTNLEFTSADVGNGARNVIPGRALLKFNVRYNDRWTPETLAVHLADRVAAIVAAHPGQGEAVFSVASRPSRSFVTPTDGPVALLAEIIAGETGTPPQFSTAGGTSDARFIFQYCPVAEFGLVGTTIHKTDENVALDDLALLTRIYGAFIGRFFA
ncbi:MAG TPA: succinyl-diaminopimelate desuccinylase [Devosia sp.]|nr:succinyl-diaminopimelate desuccinylase [Devosia sp.]